MVIRRTHLVRQRTRLKNQVHAILSRNLVPTCPHADLFSGVGRHWLSGQDLPADERRSVEALLRQLDFHGGELAEVERDIAIDAIDDPVVARLMRVPGVDVAVAISVVAAVGDFSRFDDPNKLVAYLGLNPRVRQSGNAAAVHGRITKTGRSQARGMLVEAAFSAARAPGRCGRSTAGQGPAGVPGRDRRDGPQDHRAVLAPRHQDEDYAFAAAEPQRAQAPQARTRCRGHLTPRARRRAADYHLKQLRDGRRPSSSNKNAPTKSSSLTGNPKNPPRRVDDFIRRVDDLPELGRERQERDEPVPGAFPDRDRGRVALPEAAVGEVQQGGLGGLHGRGGVDRP